MNCIFCEIVKGNIETDAIYEDDKIIAFNDQNPQAPVHILFIPKKHIESLNDVNEGNVELISKIYEELYKGEKVILFDNIIDLFIKIPRLIETNVKIKQNILGMRRRDAAQKLSYDRCFLCGFFYSFLQ